MYSIIRQKRSKSGKAIVTQFYDRTLNKYEFDFIPDIHIYPDLDTAAGYCPTGATVVAQLATQPLKHKLVPKNLNSEFPGYTQLFCVKRKDCWAIFGNLIKATV